MTQSGFCKTSAAVSKVSLALLAGLATLSSAAVPTLAADRSAKEFTVNLQPLNHSGVTGTAHVWLMDKTLTVSFDAAGLQPNMVHDAHIHGMLNGTDATCPTMAADTNGDGYVSVFEGAPFYGPIKVSLSAPITPAGPNPNATLFAPFAGVDSNAFQNADAQGMDHYNQSITYSLSDPEAAAAYHGIMPLKAQAIVIHGAMAPKSVDMMGGSTSKSVYDELLPVACGDLMNAMKGQPVDVLPTMMPTSTPSPMMTDMPGMTQMGGGSNQEVNADQQISRMYEVRNGIIDTLNRAGDVMARDQFLTAADAMIQRFADMVHMR